MVAEAMKRERTIIMPIGKLMTTVVAAGVTASLLLFGSGTLTGAASAPLGAGSSAASTNPIVAENAKPGTRSWVITKPAWPKDLRLSGYASAPSVLHGGSVILYITDNAAPQRVTLDIYRMGWYQGNGGRLLETVYVTATSQPPCTTGSIRHEITCAS
jgi:hypothetical protein